MSADNKINFYDGWGKNPYNPAGFESEIKIRNIEKDEFEELRVKLAKDGLKADTMVVTEGCHGDDTVYLGGKKEFISHFCSLFQFNICYAPGEHMMSKRTNKLLSEPDEFDSALDSLVKKVEDFK